MASFVETHVLPQKVSVETSSNDYVTGPGGDLKFFKVWHENFLPKGEDCGFKHFLESCDAVVMGRKTFDTVVGMKSWWYADKPVFVLTHRDFRLPEKLAGKANVRPLCGTPQEVLSILSILMIHIIHSILSTHDTHNTHDTYLEPYRAIYVEGSNVIKQFMDNKLLQDITVTRVPEEVKGGTRLMSEKHKASLFPLSTKKFGTAFTQTHYLVNVNI